MHKQKVVAPSEIKISQLCYRGSLYFFPKNLQLFFFFSISSKGLGRENDKGLGFVFFFFLNSLSS